MIREPNQQGFRSRALVKHIFFHPSTDTKQAIAFMYESSYPMVMADARFSFFRNAWGALPVQTCDIQQNLLFEDRDGKGLKI